MGKITKDSLGDRMKQYESVSETQLVPKMPIIIRIDGKAFHTYTRGMVKPFDEILGKCMKKTMQALCKEVHTCVFGYTQSDEITLVLKLPDRVKSQAYLNRRVQKIASLTASKATKHFNKFFTEEVNRLRSEIYVECRNKAFELAEVIDQPNQEKADKLACKIANMNVNKELGVYIRKAGDAEFDARAFNVPEWDCINNVIWRQQDAIRNSVEMVGHANFSDKELHKVNVEGIKAKLKDEKGIDWENDFSVYQRRGACCYKESEYRKTRANEKVLRTFWYIDENMTVIQNNREWFSSVTGLTED